jgi:hypothetical protein
MLYPATKRLLFISIIVTASKWTTAELFASLASSGKHFENAVNSDWDPEQGIFFSLASHDMETVFENKTAICLFLSDPLNRIF